MAGYKDSEIESVVSGFVKSSLTITQSALGPTDAESKFSEVISLFSTTLAYDPNAIFYLIYLVSNKLNVDVLAAIEYLEDILDAIDEMAKTTKDVTKTTPLGDAATSLLTVDQILTNQGAVSNPAYTRYQTSVTKFIQESLKVNVKKGSQIVRSPQLARTEAKVDLSSLATAYTDILDNLTQLQSTLDEFNSLNLPVVALQSSVTKVRSDLQDLQEYFESSSYTKDDRIAKCREAYLRLAAGKSILDNYVTVNDPSDPRLSSSSTVVGRVAVPVGDKGGLVSAAVTGTKSAPWAIVTGSNDELKIAEDGNASTTYTITAPSQPSLQSVVPETYDITASYNDLLEIDEESVLVTLTAGTGRTAANIVSDINTWATANYPGVYAASVVSSGGYNYIKITKTQAGVQRLILTAENSTYRSRVIKAYTTLGFYEGEQDDNAGVSASELAAEINAVGKVEASVVSTAFEEGTTGIAVSSVVFDLPVNTLASLSHTDDQLLIRSGKNVGYHRIVSVVRTTIDRVTVSSATPFVELVSNVGWIIVRDLLKIESESTGLDSQLVIGSCSSLTTLGLTAGTTQATTTGFRAASSGTDLDFSKSNVVVGDVLYATDLSGENKYTILELADSNKQLEIDPPFDTDLTFSAFRILSKAAVDYEDFAQELEDWVTWKDSTKFKSDTLELDRVMNALLVNKQPSASQIADAKSVAEDLYDLLTSITPGLTEILVAFVVKSVSRFDAILKMLKERGMDRAYDLLMRGKLVDFFSMDKDDAATSSFMLKSVRSVVQKDLPVSKLDDDAYDSTSTATSTTGTDAGFDYSDQDTDENVRILGDVPDFDKSGDEASTSRTRY